MIKLTRYHMRLKNIKDSWGILTIYYVGKDYKSDHVTAFQNRTNVVKDVIHHLGRKVTIW